MDAAQQPVESQKQKAQRCNKHKAQRVDLLATDREETDHTHTQMHRNIATGERKEFNQWLFFQRIKGCS